MEYILGVIVTAGAYLLVPVIVCFSGKQVKAPTIMRITIFNCIIVWLAFSIIRINAGIEGSSAAVFLWGAVGHWLMKANCLKEEPSAAQQPVRKPNRTNAVEDPFKEIRYDPEIAEENRSLQNKTPVFQHAERASMPSAIHKHTCKKCKTEFDSSFAYCPHCGKKVAKNKHTFLIVFSALVLTCVIAFAVYVSITTAKLEAIRDKAFESMYSQKFSEAKYYMDQFPDVKENFPLEYAYIEAGILMEKGEYLSALEDFKNLNYPVPASITEKLTDHVYTAGTELYRINEYSLAKQYFQAVSGHKRSEDYLTLINCRRASNPGYYQDLLDLIGFEDANKILVHSSYAGFFLNGTWKTANKSHYFQMDEEESVQYNLPHFTISGTYRILDGVYEVGSVASGYEDVFKLTVIDKNTIDVYCFKDQNTYRMYRE